MLNGFLRRLPLAKTARDKDKRELARAHHDIDRALEHIQRAHSRFEEPHPDYAEALQIMAQYLIQVQGWILAFWAKAYGKPPKDIDTWRGA